MYTLRILTQNEECKNFFLSMDLKFKFYKEEEDYVFEIEFIIKENAELFLERVTNILCNYDDSDAWVYEQEQETDEPLDDYINDKYFY